MAQTDKKVEWKARFDTWKSSGLSVAHWCRQQGLKDHQMYYWIQKFESDTSLEKDTSETQWLTVDVEDEPTRVASEEPVFIHFGQISVEVRPGVNTDLLSDIVQVLQNQC